MPTPGAPGANSRGRGGKFKKFTRGGGKHYSRDLRPLDADGNEISMWSMNAKQARGPGGDSADGGSSEDEDEDDDDESDEGAGGQQPMPPGLGAEEDSREARKGAKKAKKAKKAEAIARIKAKSVQVGDMPSDDEDSSEDDEVLSANPNHSLAARKQATPRQAEDVPSTTSGPRAIPAGLQHQSMEQRKADLERLQGIKKQREADAKIKEVELAEKQLVDSTRNAERVAKEADRRANALGKDKKSKN